MWIIRGFLPIPLALALAWLALLPAAQAVCREGCDNDNTFLGDDALLNNTDGSGNTAIGFEALDFNDTGNDNTATGAYALRNNQGDENTANGHAALDFNDTGSNNTANGFDALFNNTTGSRNVATGDSALYSNETGIDNTATGVNALYYNTGNYNTAHGYQALESNTTGTNNTASGLNALNLNTSGSFNAAHGAYALYNNTNTGNTATGYEAAYSTTIGNYNLAEGYETLFKNTSGFSNTATGALALYNNTSGHGNIALGYNAGLNLSTGSNNIDIGNLGVAGESSKIRIGKIGTQTNTYIVGISGVTVPGGIGVIVDSSGHLGTTTSSARYKDNIQPMDKASEAILALEPVTFRYKHELDPDGIPQFGLVAEQVEKVNPDLVARDEQGKPYTVRYEAVNAMLLNEFLKEHRKGQQQDATISELKSAVAQQRQEIIALTASLKEQASQIQKVSARIEVTKPAPQMVLNNQ